MTKTSLTLCGFMGCGKTTVGRALARRLGFAFADTDELLVRETGLTIPQIFERGGEALFRDLEHETVARAALLPDTVLSTGGGVMTFERNARILAEHTTVLYIDRPFEDCYAFLSRQEGRPLVRSEAEMRALYEARIPRYRQYAALTLPNRGSVEDAVEEALRMLEK